MNEGPRRRIADQIARWLLGRDAADRLTADLREEYEAFVLPERGRRSATIWYWRQVLSSALVMRVKRVGTERASGQIGRTRVLDSVAQDVRFARRQFRKAPTFTVAAVVTLALGIGATTAIFSVVNTVLLRSLPYDQPERILRAWAHTDDGDITDFSFRVVEYQELATRTDVFEAVGAEFPVSLTVLTPDAEPHQVQGRMITADFFEVFGARLALGRPFERGEIAAGDRPLVIVTHGFWTRFLGADAEVLNTPLDMNGTSFTVVGVLRPDYEHVSGSDAQMFIPFTLGTSGWIAHWLDLYARVQPGVSLERAGEEINAVLGSIGETDRRSAGWNATVEGVHEMVVGDVRPVVWAMFGMVVLVLLIAAVNVANLTLARASTRVEEMAVRTALGAGRRRLARQLLIENLLLAASGGILGLGVAVLALETLIGIAPDSIPRLSQTSLDPTVLGFSALVTLGSGLLFGLAPIVRSSTMPSAGTAGHRTSHGGGGRGASRALGGLVVSEVALALVLLVSAGLMMRTLFELNREDLGFQRGGALTFRVSVPSSRYPTGADTEAFYSELRRALSSLPGVVAVGAGSDLPVSGQGAVASVTSPERVEEGIEEGVTALQRRATAGFFAAIGTPLVAGREFDGSDRADGPTVAIISESLARSVFADGSAVGRRVAFGANPDDEDWMTVVGVVRDVRYEGVDRIPDPQIYQAHPQSAVRQMAVVVRTAGDPLALSGPARDAVGAIDAQVPVYSMTTLQGLVDVALAGRRFTMVLFTAFAAVALVLTLAGIYGVLAFSVSRQRTAIGVRMALGAQGRDVTLFVLGRGISMLGLGIAFGFAGALLGGRALGGLVYGVNATDPATFAAVVVLLVGVGLAACWLPAYGASRTDPMTVLRQD